MRLSRHLALWSIVAGTTTTGTALAHDRREPRLEFIGRYQPPDPAFDEGVSEIVAYDEDNEELYVVNARDASVEILSLADPAHPTPVAEIDVGAFGGVANSVAVKDGVVAIAVEAFVKQDPGQIIFFDTDRNFLSAVPVGALPDNVVFSPDGRFAVAACEGEPNDDYTRDPEGSVAIVDINRGAHRPSVAIADFRGWNNRPLPASVRVFGPGSTVAQDFEPEYCAVSPDSKTAYVTLQENNAIATIDLRRGKVTDINGLGFKNHARPGNGIDASDRDGAINIAQWPVFGMYLPDAIVAFREGSKTFLVMANEGDSRAYSGFDEEERIGGVTLDPRAFPNAAALQASSALGRLKITSTLGDKDGDGDFDELYSYGARSISIRRPDGSLVWDSGDKLERLIAQKLPANFNAASDSNTFDGRSDDKGPEPEGVVIGEAYGKRLLFLGLERVGGIVVFDLDCIDRPEIIDYINTRDFTKDPTTELTTSGDNSPEGLLFIPADKSPNGRPLLVSGNEVNGTTAVFQVVLR